MKISLVTLLLFYLVAWTAPANAATLSLSPSSVAFNVGEQRTLSLSLDPQGESIIGTDVILTYNPQHLKVISVVNRNLFQGVPAVKIVNEVGSTKFSLINNFGIYQTNSGVAADITIQAINPATSTPLILSFVPGSTVDTNVVINGGQDVLTAVTNATFTIPGPTATPTPIPPTTVLETRANPNATGAAALSIVPPGFTSPLPGNQQATPPSPRQRTLGTATQELPNYLPWLIGSGAAALLLIFITYVMAKRARQKPTVVKPTRSFSSSTPSVLVHSVSY